MILITGGTGLVGAHLLYHLLKQGETNIRAIHRKESNLKAVSHVFEYYESSEKATQFYNTIEWLEADILDIAALEKAFIGVSKVYHCAGLICYDVRDRKKLRTVNIEGTANIVNLCIAFNIEKLCHVSSIAAIGSGAKNTVLNEESIWNAEAAHSHYAWSKYGAEMEVWRGTQEGVNAVIVNPGVIVGPGFWNSGSGLLFKQTDKGFKWKLPFETGFVDVLDVVKAMYSLMESTIINQRFILVTDNEPFYKIQQYIASAINSKQPKYLVRKWQLSILWMLQSLGRYLLGTAQTITYDSLTQFHKSKSYSNTKLKDRLMFTFKPLSKSVQDTAKVYLKDKNKNYI